MITGKGDKDSRSPDFEKRTEAWDRIFGKNKPQKPKDKKKNGK